MLQPLKPKNLKLNVSMKISKTFWNTKIKDVLFVIGDWNPKVGSQETPGVTDKFGLGIWNEAGQRLIEFCQENALVIANTLFQQQEMTLQMGITRWSVPKSD